MLNTSTSAKAAPARHIPGEAGVWVLILGDMVVFSLLFLTYMYYRGQDVALFREAQTHLNQLFGAFNTLLMLTSSWLVASAVQLARRQQPGKARTFLIGALLCGLGFATVKYFEYTAKFDAGITLVTNDFFMYYFVLTMIHLLHVFFAMGVLVYLINLLSSKEVTERQLSFLESGASFWHVVDMLWIVLFALLYLVN